MLNKSKPADIDELPAIKILLATPVLPDLGPGPRKDVLPLAALQQKCDGLFNSSKLPPASRELVRCLALLWHDHLDAGHEIAQNISNADGSFLHGIMHRREPDYGNAKYWFRRVGEHPCFPAISQQASRLLADASDRLLVDKLVPRGQWDSFAFVDACERAAKNFGTEAQRQRLRELQALEFKVLLAHFCQRSQ